MIGVMTRVAEDLAPSSSPTPDARPAEPSPEQRAERLAERIKADARHAAEPYLRDTVVLGGGE